MQTLRISLGLVLAGAAFAQFPGLSLPPSGNNQKATVVQFIGPVRISIDYSSPAVHGPDGKDRHGQIWGKLVPYGLSNQGFGNGKPTPWRAGANENTLFTASHEVMIEGKPLPAGRYGVFMIPGQEEWTVIFSKVTGAWGSFWYEDADDALRVTVKPHKHEYREYLTYEFPLRKPTEATAELQWEEVAVPWNIKVKGDVDDIYVSRLRQDLENQAGFSPQGWDAAAQYVIQSGKNLDQGLKWADIALNDKFIGQKNFNTLSTKAQVLAKMGKLEDSGKLMDEAIHLPGTNPLQIHQYGRTLLTMKMTDQAVKVFEFNAEKNGDVWPTHVGLMRAYAAKGDIPKALEHAKRALTQAPDDLNKNSLEGMVKTFESGKNIEQ
jgi:hypothetical protein